MGRVRAFCVSHVYQLLGVGIRSRSTIHPLSCSKVDMSYTVTHRHLPQNRSSGLPKVWISRGTPQLPSSTNPALLEPSEDQGMSVPQTSYSQVPRFNSASPTLTSPAIQLFNSCDLDQLSSRVHPRPLSSAKAAQTPPTGPLARCSSVSSQWSPMCFRLQLLFVKFCSCVADLSVVQVHKVALL